MALVVNMKEGHTLHIGGYNYLVKEITDEHVNLMDMDSEEEYLIDKAGASLSLNVKIYKGSKGGNTNAQLVIDAPQPVPIIRNIEVKLSEA